MCIAKQDDAVDLSQDEDVQNKFKLYQEALNDYS